MERSRPTTEPWSGSEDMSQNIVLQSPHFDSFDNAKEWAVTLGTGLRAHFHTPMVRIDYIPHSGWRVTMTLDLAPRLADLE